MADFKWRLCLPPAQARFGGLAHLAHKDGSRICWLPYLASEASLSSTMSLSSQTYLTRVQNGVQGSVHASIAPGHAGCGPLCTLWLLAAS